MSLRHAELKVGRALEHLEDLKRELQAYYEGDPCPVTLYRAIINLTNPQASCIIGRDGQGGSA